ncbi:MAG: hypothetical protein KKC05_02620 [Nanoarchaeota archaeon]|nr:hypothetical protein [Nanoarchaeota archaeon]
MNNTVITILGAFLLIIIGIAFAGVMHTPTPGIVRLSPSSGCADLGAACSYSGDSVCCPTYLTDHGTFYGYCDGTCKVADGINGNLNDFEWCNNHRNLPPYRSFAGLDFLSWYYDTNCDDLFYGFQGPPDVGPNGFRGGYDYLNNRVQIADESGNIVETNYYDTKGYGNMYASFSPVSGLVVVSTDPMGRVHQTNSNGNKMRNTYDGLDRITKTQFYKANGENDFTIDYCYDSYCDGGSCASPSSFNLLCEIRDNSGKTKFRYDQRGMVTWQEKNIYSSEYGEKVYRLAFEYNSADLVTRMTLPDGAVVIYKYDSLGQLIDIDYVSDGKTENMAELSYTEFGAIKEKVLDPDDRADFITAEYGYDEKQQLETMDFIQRGVSIFEREMDYDMVGNVKTISYEIGSTTPEERYGYDNLYRLTSAAYKSGHTFGFTYENLWGDRATKTVSGKLTIYDYIGPKLTSITEDGETTGLAYDISGNLILETLPPNPTKYYKYDSLNRMIKSGVDDKVTEYIYDYTNKRVVKITDNETIFYLYQGNNVIYEEEFYTVELKVCGDGTPYNECSGPFFCDEGELVSKCSVCGCPAGECCDANKCIPSGQCSTFH